MQMLWLSRKDIEHISRRLLRDYLKKVPQKVDHIDPADFAEKMCGLQFTFADISEAHDAIGLTATSGVIITIPQRDGTRLDYELDGKTAFIDQSLVAENQIGRLNFTMMHEAAHQLLWMLYPEEYEAQTPRCVFRIQTEQQELKKQYSSHITMARICPYCQNKLEILCKGNHGAVYVKCPHCGEQVFFPPVAFRLNRF